MRTWLNRVKAYYIHAQFFPRPWDLWINTFYISRKHLVGEIRSLVPALEGKVLDFGCGSKPYQQLFVGKKLVGVDIAESGNTYRGNQIDFFYDGKTLPFEDNSFDSIFSSEVFEHVPNLEEILAELRRVLKPKGKMLITMPFIWDEHETPYDFTRFTSFGFAKLLKKNGFEVIEQRKTGSSVDTITQLIAAYVASWFYGFNIYFQILLCTLIVSPVLILGCALARVLPSRNSLYLNNVILVQKN